MVDETIKTIRNQVLSKQFLWEYNLALEARKNNMEDEGSKILWLRKSVTSPEQVVCISLVTQNLIIFGCCELKFKN